MNTNQIAQQIVSEINTETSFDLFSIAGFLQLMSVEKPQYQTYQYIGAGLNSLVLKVSEELALKIIKVNKQNQQLLFELDQRVTAVRSAGKNNYIHQVDQSYFLSQVQGQDSVYVFYVQEMELYSGNLDTYLGNLARDNKELNEDQKERISIQIIDSLIMIHQFGFFHKNIKLTNILFKELQNNQVVFKIADLGIYKLEDFAKWNVYGGLNRKANVNLFFAALSTKDFDKKIVDIYQPQEAYFNIYTSQSDFYSLALVLLQLENTQYDFQNIQINEFVAIQNKLEQNTFPLEQSLLNETSLLSQLIQGWLKKNPEERKDGPSSLAHLLLKQKQCSLNEDLQVYSINSNIKQFAQGQQQQSSQQGQTEQQLNEWNISWADLKAEEVQGFEKIVSRFEDTKEGYINLSEIKIDLECPENKKKNKLDDESMILISKILRQLKLVQVLELNLQSNQVGDAGLRVLCEALLECQALKSLQLNFVDNEISDMGFYNLCDTLKQFQRLEKVELVLNGNSFSDSSAILETFNNEIKPLISECFIGV